VNAASVPTLSAATRRETESVRAVALPGGMKAWREAGYPVRSGGEPLTNPG
jgi:hypothetical protein